MNYKDNAPYELITYRAVVLLISGLLCYLALAFIQGEVSTSYWSTAFRVAWVLLTWLTYISFKQAADDRYYRAGEKEVFNSFKSDEKADTI